MLQEQMYKQCLLERPNKHENLLGKTRTMTWLPTEFAIEGNVVRLKDKRDQWSPPWLIISASGPEQPEKFVRKMERAHLTQRKCSDI